MATILKPHSPSVLPSTSAPSGLAGFNFDDLSKQALARLEDCRCEVARMLEQAGVEADRIKRSAHTTGLAEGRDAAAKEAQEKLARAIDQRLGEHTSAVRSAVDQIADLHQRWMDQYAERLIEIAVSIAERILRERLDREPTILARWVKEALQESRSAQRLTVAVHPETLAELGGLLDELLATPGLPEETTLLPDESVPRTGVVVRQIGGAIDAGLQTQLDQLSSQLRLA